MQLTAPADLRYQTLPIQRPSNERSQSYMSGHFQGNNNSTKTKQSFPIIPTLTMILALIGSQLSLPFLKAAPQEKNETSQTVTLPTPAQQIKDQKTFTLYNTYHKKDYPIVLAYLKSQLAASSFMVIRMEGNNLKISLSLQKDGQITTEEIFLSELKPEEQEPFLDAYFKATKSRPIYTDEATFVQLLEGIKPNSEIELSDTYDIPSMDSSREQDYTLIIKSLGSPERVFLISTTQWSKAIATTAKAKNITFTHKPRLRLSDLPH